MLIQLVITLLILGAVLYILNLVPIDTRIKQIINIIIVIGAVIYALQLLIGSGRFYSGLP